MYLAEQRLLDVRAGRSTMWSAALAWRVEFARSRWRMIAACSLAQRTPLLTATGAAASLNHHLRLLLCFAPLAWWHTDLCAKGAGKRRLAAVSHGIGHLQQ